MTRCNLPLFELCSSKDPPVTRPCVTIALPARLRNAFGRQNQGRVHAFHSVYAAPVDSDRERSQSSSRKQYHDSATHIRCDACCQWLPPALFCQDEMGRSLPACRKCKENARVARPLLTTCEDLSHMDVWRLRLNQREVEQLLLRACRSFGLNEWALCLRVLDFLRIPCVAAYGTRQCCELCGQELDHRQIDAHLRSAAHRARVRPLASGRLRLLSDVALELSSRLGEPPSTSLSRLRQGLGLKGRTCEPESYERATCLERLTKLPVPPSFLDEALPYARRHLVWIAPEEASQLVELYQRRREDEAQTQKPLKPSRVPWFTKPPSSSVELKMKLLKSKLGWK